MTPTQFAVPGWKVATVWAYVALVLVACALAVRQWRRARGSPAADVAAIAAVWLLGNTLFVLCTGSRWGFFYFDRHILAALPALLWVLREWYPRRASLWVVAGALSAVGGLAGLVTSVV